MRQSHPVAPSADLRRPGPSTKDPPHERVRPDRTKALVTGGARGLGAGMAEALARAGAAVVIGDIREELGQATADALTSPAVTPSSCRWTSPTTTAGNGASRAPSANSAAWTSWSTTPAWRSPAARRPGPGRRPPDARGQHPRHLARHQARLPGHAPGRPGRPRRRRRQHRVGRRHDRLPRHRRLLRDQVRGRPADPGGGHGVRQARLRRPGELHLPRPGPDRDGQPAGPGRGGRSACSRACPRPSAPWSG